MFTDSQSVAQPLIFSSPAAAYVHIPFCRRRCFYCDFPIAVVGDQARGETSGAIEQYVEVLCREIQATPALGQPLSTVFFGGGTPSLLSVDQLERILYTLEHHFGLAPGAEISLEVDPGTFTRSQLQGYQQAGVNRLSLGVQAFEPELLSLCGRSHTVPQIYEAIDLIRQVGFPNLSLDLISGLPGQTLANWHRSLETAIALGPQHLSLYDLTIEPGTVFERRYRPGDAPLPSDETTAKMYRLAVQVLVAAGYDHYEISNYARPGSACRHNRTYWQNRSYYGFGMGATSYIQGQRFTRPRKRQAYFRWVRDFVQAGGDLECPAVALQDRLLETLMLGLRLAEGLELAVLAAQFGSSAVAQILNCLQPYREQGWVEIDPHPAAPARIRLSDPEGFLFSNQVLVALWQTFDPD